MTPELPKPSMLPVTHENGTLPVAGLTPIPMQTGVRPDQQRNGYLDVELLDGIANQLDSFRNGPLWCDETGQAIELIRAGIRALRDRSERRKKEGVYGEMVETPKNA